MNKGKRSSHPDPVDVHVGARLRLRRNLIGLSQERLGNAVGLTFQQIQKYERGTNRMGASRLLHIAKLLNVPISYFFDDNPTGKTETKDFAAGFSGQNQALFNGANGADTELLYRQETLELVRAYYRITDAKNRRKLYDLVRSLGKLGRIKTGEQPDLAQSLLTEFSV